MTATTTPDEPRNSANRFAVLCLGGALLLSAALPSPALTDLRASSDGHRLEKTDGTPFLLLSDTQWQLNAYSDVKVAEILDNRVAKGFTAVQVFATHAYVGSPKLTDYNNNLPFVGNNPEVLNAAYWNRWRTICDMAAARGLHFILVMGEPGRLCDTGVPWRFLDNTTTSHTRAYNYARQVAGHFATAPNVIFCQGQDTQADGRTLPGYSSGCFNADGWRAMAEGTADGVNGVNNRDGQANYATTLMTYHGCERAPSAYYSDISVAFQNDAWIDFYGPEVFHDNGYVYTVVNRDYALAAPVKPSFVMEGSYEDGTETGAATTPAYVRIEAWHSLFGGLCGYAYGHVKNYNQVGDTAFLNDTAAGQMTHVASFANQHAWWLWVPDNGLITVNAGSLATRKVGVRSTAGDKCAVYFPVNTVATIKNLLAVDTTAAWFRPTDGSTSAAGTFTAGQSRSMTPPTGWEDSVLVLTAVAGGGTVAAPTFSPAAGTYPSAQSVTITSATSGASIRYTLDGSTPTSSSGLVYSTPVAISATATLKAIAFKTGMTDSGVASGLYTIGSSGELLTNTGFETDLTGWSANGGSVARITTQQHSGAAACRSYNRSANWCGPKQVIKNALTANGAGNYTVSAWVKLASGSDTGRIQLGVKVAGVWTWFTAEGSIPAGAWGQVTGTLPVTWSGALEDAWFVVNTATSTAELYADDCSLEKGEGTPPPETLATPTFSPAAGTYPSAQSVTITSATSGASIRYTLDGSTPTSSSGLVYSTPVAISATATLKAIASKTGMADSGVASGLYTIESAPPASSDLVNGSFEDGTNGWSITANGGGTAACAVLDTQGASDPTHAMALGTGNAAGNAVIAQTVVTTVGAACALLFDYGAFGASGKQQQLRVEALDGTTVLASTVVSAYGPGNYLPGSTTFAERTLAFTAASAATTVRFTDLTTLANSNSCDGMLDAIELLVSAGLPSPWLNADIGAVGVAGGAVEAGGVFTVDGAGADIWGTADAFQFVYQTASGDCEIKARVAAVEYTDPWAKAGVMVRETLNANSMHAMAVLTPSNGANLMYRNSTGGSCGYAQSTGKAGPYWVRVVRSGNSFTAYHSPDAAAWTQVGAAQTIPMGTSVYVGLCVTSHNITELNTSTFDSVTVTP